MDSSLVLSILAPLIDHLHEATTSSLNHGLLNLWAFFCFSLTILYGGEAVSSLTILNSPEYPKTLIDMCRLTPQVYTRTGSISRLQGVDQARIAQQIT